MKILNRIVTFVLALGVFPVLFFQVLLRAVVSISSDSSLYSILSAFLSESTNSKMEIELSVKELIGYFQDGMFSFAGMDFSLEKIPSDLLITKNWLIASGACLVAALLIALVIMGCALFAKAHKTVMCLGASGVAVTFAAVRCFTKFAEPFVNGTIDIGSMLADSLLGDSSGILGSIGSSLLKGAISVDVLQIGNVAMIFAMIFIGITFWTLAYYLTMPASEKKTRVKKNI